MGNAKFIHQVELDEFLNKTGATPKNNTEYLDAITSMYPWTKVIVFVTAGVIAFETESSYAGWLTCQG